MTFTSSPAKAGAQEPEGLDYLTEYQKSLRFACDDWAPAFAGELDV